MYLLMFSSMWMLSRGLGHPVPLVYFLAIIPDHDSIDVGADTSINGIGVREASLSLFLAPLGVPPAVSVSLGLLSFVNLVVIGLIGGIVFSFGVYPKLELDKQVETELTAV